MTGWSWETKVLANDRGVLASVPDSGNVYMGQCSSFGRAPTTTWILLWPCEGQSTDANQWDCFASKFTQGWERMQETLRLSSLFLTCAQVSQWWCFYIVTVSLFKRSEVASGCHCSLCVHFLIKCGYWRQGAELSWILLARNHWSLAVCLWL